MAAFVLVVLSSGINYLAFFMRIVLSGRGLPRVSGAR